MRSHASGDTWTQLVALTVGAAGRALTMQAVMSTTRPAMLQALSLKKSYGSRLVVDELSLQLKAGQIVGLLGPNGAGKSTTVAMLCGLVTPDAGQVLLDPGSAGGRQQAGGVIGVGNAAHKRRIGLVPQDLALYEDLSAEANLALFGALYGLSGDLLKRRCADALALVGLSSRAKEPPSRFSGGMKRRVNIACALVHDPDILLLDEPTVGVDPQSRNAIFDNLETLRDAGKALLYTTHYMEEAERLCDHIVVMDHGRAVAADTLDGLVARLPAAQALSLVLAPGAAVDMAALAGLPLVQQASQQATTLKLLLAADGHGHGLAAGTACVMQWLQAQGHVVSHVASERANLEDVFMALTGRQLRD